MRVCIAGAGVVALNTGLQVQRELGPSAEVTIMGDKFNEETTADGAAGLIMPATYFAGPTRDITRQWMRDSFSWFGNLARSDEAEAAGISEVCGYQFSNVSDAKCENFWMREFATEYRTATAEELSLVDGGARYGRYMKTFVLDCRQFLPWALNKLGENGARVIRRKVNNWSELAGDFDVVFNCTGLGARELCDDLTLVPIRGQVYKVKAPWIKDFVYTDNDTYVIPKKCHVTLGGSRFFGSWKLEVDPHESAAIWEKCVKALPSLRRAEVLTEWVGLRPHRSPVRVEAELVQLSGAGHTPLKVIHNYGHGGYGITTAPGTAMHAVSVLKDVLRASGRSGMYNSKL